MEYKWEDRPRKDKRGHDKRDRSRESKFDSHKRIDNVHDLRDFIEDKKHNTNKLNYEIKQDLNLKVVDGASIHYDGMVPLIGKKAPEHPTNIDHFDKVAPLYNSSMQEIYQDFRDVDTDSSTYQAQIADYVMVQLDVLGYNQMPGSYYSNQTTAGELNMPESGNWYSSSSGYQSYTTKRLVDVNQQNQRILAIFALNDTYANTPALNASIVWPYDGNPFLPRISIITAWVDAINTGMLKLVTELKYYELNKYLLKYFIAKHPAYAQYLQDALTRISTKRFTNVLDQVCDVLEKIPCDVQYVKDYSDLFTSVSRSGNSYYDPILLTQVTFENQQYQIQLGSDGISFTPVPENINFRSETQANPYFFSNAAYNMVPAAMSLWENLQGNATNPSQCQTIVNNWVTSVTSSLNLLLTKSNTLYNMMSQFIGLFNLAYTSKMTRLSTYRWDYKYTVYFRYDPTIWTLIAHPEIYITSVYNTTGQYGVSIGMDKGKIDLTLGDSTRMYAITSETIFNEETNVWINGANYSPALAYTNTDYDTLNTVDSNNCVEGIYQFPCVQIYDYCWVRTLGYNSGNNNPELMVYIVPANGTLQLNGTNTDINRAWSVEGSVPISINNLTDVFGVVISEQDTTVSLYDTKYDQMLRIVMSDVTSQLYKRMLQTTAFTNTIDAEEATKVVGVVKGY